MAHGVRRDPVVSLQAASPRPELTAQEDHPDWGAIARDVTCSRCGQDLRTLVEPRCPECGLAFQWSDLLDRSGCRGDRPGEHRLSGRLVRSWITAFRRSLRPGRFWRGLSIHDDSRPGTLWLSLLAGPLVFLLTLNVLLRSFTLIARFVDTVAREHGWLRVMSVARYATDHLRSDVTEMLSSVPGTALLLAGWVLVPPLVMIALFWACWRLARCRVRKVQVLRVVARSAGPVGFLEGVLLSATLAAIAVVRGLNGMTGNWEDCMEWWMQRGVWPVVGNYIWPVCAVLLFLIPLVYLRAGLRDYLRLGSATRIAVTALAIACAVAVLAVTTVMMIALQGYT